MSLASVFDIAASGTYAQTIRLNTTASNMANAQSVAGSEEAAYKARKPVFAAQLQSLVNPTSPNGSQQRINQFGVSVEGIVESTAPVTTAYEPNHPMADEKGYVYYSNVNSVEEMAEMISASRAFQMNIEMMNTTKSMMQRMLTLGQ